MRVFENGFAIVVACLVSVSPLAGDDNASERPLIHGAAFNSRNSYVVVRNGFRRGAKLWTDREYVVKKLPIDLSGGTLLQTPMEDRGNKNDDLISFAVLENCVVYVGIKAGRKRPDWLGSWEKTDLTVEASNTLVYSRKPFSAGEKVVLGGGSTGLQAMYSVVITENADKSTAVPSEKHGWVNLIADDSLAHWAPGPSKSNPTDIGSLWSLTDGVLHLDKSKKGRGGPIWTKKHYDEFELTFEFNIAFNGNSGVKYRVVDVDGSALGCEYQIIDDDNYRDNKNPTHRTACLYELASVPVDRKWNPAGEWNQGRVRVLNNTFEHWLNGEKVTSVTFGSEDWKQRFSKSKYRIHPDFAKTAGPILLQDHGDSVSYRNLYIRELNSEQIGPVATATKPRKTGTQELSEPLAFTVNCRACHLLDQTGVGPSLVEMAELYPRENKDRFIHWAISPGRKRDQMPQMPSMAHVPKEQLSEIYDYIKTVTVGVKRVKTSNIDSYATAPAKTKRPRIERTFVPNSGPASLILALPTEKKHNVIWDTDQCRLRYISTGEPDNYAYLRSNGNSLALVGEIIYRESQSIFTAAGDVQYKGYHISKEGYPSFVYQLGESEVTETISVDVERQSIVRSFKATPQLPDYEIPPPPDDRLTTEVTKSDKAISISYTAKK